MTVKDLIEVLQQCPEPESQVQIRTVTGSAEDLTWSDSQVADVHEDHGIVIIETDWRQ